MHMGQEIAMLVTLQEADSDDEIDHNGPVHGVKRASAVMTQQTGSSGAFEHPRAVDREIHRLCS